MAVSASKPEPAPQEYRDEDVETMPRKKLAAMQPSLRRDHLEHAFGNAPHDRRLFDAAGD